MKFSEELGIRIDGEVMELLKKAVEFAGNRRKLAAAVKIGYTTLGNWLGVNEQKGEFITWEQWQPLKNYMVTARLIDGSDPRWMIPSEMRERLIRLAKDMPVSNDERILVENYRLANEAGKIAIAATAQAQAAITKREDSKYGEKAE